MVKKAVFSRARWCFRQCAWPARRHARKDHRRARERASWERAEILLQFEFGSAHSEVETRCWVRWK
jgi:hypothetical protein